MRYARIYPWRRTRRFRAPSNGLEAYFVAQFSAGYTTNMFGFDLRQGQPSMRSERRLLLFCGGYLGAIWLIAVNITGGIEQKLLAGPSVCNLGMSVRLNTFNGLRTFGSVLAPL